MSLDFTAIQDSIVSHAMALGVFDQVNMAEPKSAPGTGIYCAIWADTITPAESGLASTSVRLVMMGRVYCNFQSYDEATIDITVMNATGSLMEALSGDIDLGGNARNIDLLGRGGTPLSARAGYLNQDSKLFRIAEITIPVIMNDVWDQVA